MYVYYSEDEASAELQGHRPSVSGPARTFRRARRAWLTLLTTCIFGFVVALISATISHLFPLASQTWATILGVAVAALACGQWIPQMLKTWKLGHLGSLSLISLGLSVPVRFFSVQKKKQKSPSPLFLPPFLLISRLQ